jgi:hypothetical protein
MWIIWRLIGDKRHQIGIVRDSKQFGAMRKYLEALPHAFKYRATRRVTNGKVG